MNDQLDRHSKAFDAELITDPDELAAREARNGLCQFDAVVEMVDAFIQRNREFRLRLSHLLHLHRIALDGISQYAGNFRPAGIKIGGSRHQPVGAHLIPGEVEELCDYVNEHWNATPIHLAAYILWRVNWIHPFTDGNGRTARAMSYVVLCVRLGYLLPGTNTIAEQIAGDKGPYYKALEAADEAWRNHKLDLSALEEYLASLLANQLVSIHAKATGRIDTLETEALDRKFH